MSEKDLQKTQNTAAMERIRNVKTFVPRVDIYETREALFLIADMPGVDDKDCRCGTGKKCSDNFRTSGRWQGQGSYAGVFRI